MNQAAATMLALLAQWVQRGWLRRLDVAFSRFIAEHDPEASAQLLLVGAWVAHLESLGHSGLPLADWLDQPAGARAQLSGWSEEALAAMVQALAPLPVSVDAWIHALKHSPAVDASGQGAAPLVLADGRLFLRRYRDYEQRLAQQIRSRCGPVSAVDEASAQALLMQWFPQRDASVFDWQQAACALSLGARLTLITGGPGTGKTHTAARLLALLCATAPEPSALRVALAAPTGKAAARLKQSIDTALQTLPQAPPGLAARLGPARTLHALLGARPDTRRLSHDSTHPLPLDLLIVDEASMVHLEMMAALLDALPASAHLVLLGDKDQLASVEAGAVLADLCAGAEAGRYQPETAARLQRLTGQALPTEMIDLEGPALSQHTVMLRTSQRFGGEIAALAQAVQAGDAARVVALASAGTDASVAWRCPASAADAVAIACAGRAGAETAGFEAHLAHIKAGPPLDVVSADAYAAWVCGVLQSFDRVRLLCALREGDWGVAGLNAAVESRLRAQGLIGGRGDWYAGRPVMVVRNDPVLGVYNGDIGIALQNGPGDPAAAMLRVWFSAADGGARSFSLARLRYLETAFAMTVHKSQGSEFGHVVLVLAPEAARVATREWLYTGITRARQALTLVSAQPGGATDAVHTVTRRTSGLGPLLAAPARQ